MIKMTKMMSSMALSAATDAGLNWELLVKKAKPTVPQPGFEEVTGYLQKLYAAAKGSCRGQRESWSSASLLTDNSTVFSTGNGDVGQTDLVEHCIPVKEGMRPIWLPPQWLEPVKEAEYGKQVHDLLKKGMIKPVSGAVVLGKKKDGKWWILYRLQMAE